MPDENLRAIFDEDAQLYHLARPGYPAELFRRLGELAETGPGARIAEIGPGTGQATAVLASQGAQVVAVELGPSLASVLRRELASSAVEVVVSAFEQWTVPPERFDTVAAFTSWHWLDATVRTPKAAAALRPGGALATVTTSHVLGGTEESSPMYRTATSGGTPPRRQTCGCRMRTRSPPPLTKSMTRSCSGRPSGIVTSRRSPTPPAVTFSCSAPTPLIGP